jgi:hypothetical protein
MSRSAKMGISLAAVAAVAALVVGGTLLITRHGARHPAVAQSPMPTFTGTPSASPSASPSPKPKPMPANCSNAPHLCGFPDATNSGVPAKMRKTLRSVPGQVSSGPGWHYDPRGWVEVDGNGAVLKGLSIPYNVDVTASDVTIEDDVIVNTGDNFGVSIRHSRGVTVKDCDISSPYTDSRRLMVGVKDVDGDATGIKVVGNNIWHTATGVQIVTGLIANNYIHSIGFKPGDHVNGITVDGGTTPLTIRHNTVFVNLDQTDAISLFEDSAARPTSWSRTTWSRAAATASTAARNPAARTATTSGSSATGSAASTTPTAGSSARPRTSTAGGGTSGPATSGTARKQRSPAPDARGPEAGLATRSSARR